MLEMKEREWAGTRRENVSREAHIAGRCYFMDNVAFTLCKHGYSLIKLEGLANVCEKTKQCWMRPGRRAAQGW